MEGSNQSQPHAVTITALVHSDNYVELRKRVKVISEFVESVLKSDPNTEGFYIGVDDIWYNVKPPIGISREDDDSEIQQDESLPEIPETENSLNP